MSTEENSSSLKAYIDSGIGAAQSLVASITGSAGDQANADATQQKAAAEHDLSHATLKVGSHTVSSSGAVAKDDPNRTQGSWDQTIGSAKEAVGGLIGSDNLKQQGREQNIAGQQLEAKGQLSDLGKGVSDRVTGAVGGAAAGLTGDHAGQAKFAEQHDSGKSLLRGVEADLNKQAQAERK